MVASESSVALFIGDSITAAGRRFDRSSGLGRGYVRMVHDRLAPRVTVVNRGLSGDRAADLVERWDRDARDLHPDVLTIFVGINDVWRRYDEGDETPLSSFEADVRFLVSSACSFAARVIVIEPFLLETHASQHAWREDLDPKRTALSAVAAEFGVAFIPLDSLMRAAGKEHGVRSLTDDGVHPTLAGHRLIANVWLAEYRSSP